MTKPDPRSKGRRPWPGTTPIEPDLPLNLKTKRTCLHSMQRVYRNSQGVLIQSCVRCDWSTPVEEK